MARGIAAIAVVALALALRAPVAELPFERDEGEYAYVAQRWQAGDVPYRDAFYQKPPASFAFYALAFRAFGETPGAVRWAAQLWLIAGLAALAALGARLATPAAGLAAAALGALLAVDPAWLGNAVNTELLAVTPLALAGWLAHRALGRERRAAAALAVGALGGVALLCKPVVAPMGLFAIATVAWRARRPGAVFAAAAAGLGVVLGAVAAAFAAAGALAPFLDATVWNNLAYAVGTPLAHYPAYFRAGIGPSLVPFAPLYAAAALAPFLAGAPRRGLTARRAPGGVAWAVGWLLAAVPAIAAGGYFRQHYFHLAIPPLALLAGAGVDALARRLAPRRAGAVAALLVAAIVAHAVVRGAWYYRPGPAAPKLARLYGSNPFPEAPALGRWLAARAAPGDRAFVYGSEPQLLFYAGLPSASRYIFVYPLTMPVGHVAERQREALAELAAAPPRFVVGVFVRTSLLEQPGTPPALREGVRALVEGGYEIAAVAPFDRERSGRILEGAAARSMWRERPLWDGAVPWAAFVVWERREPGQVPGPTRADPVR